MDLRWYDDAALCVVMATRGYPGAYVNGSEIRGLDEAERLDGVTVLPCRDAARAGPRDRERRPRPERHRPGTDPARGAGSRLCRGRSDRLAGGFLPARHRLARARSSRALRATRTSCVPAGPPYSPARLRAVGESRTMATAHHAPITFADLLWPARGASRPLRLLLLALLGSALLTISAKIEVPFYPVPMTMQTLVVLLLGMAYGARLGRRDRAALSGRGRGRPARLRRHPRARHRHRLHGGADRRLPDRLRAVGSRSPAGSPSAVATGRHSCSR